MSGRIESIMAFLCLSVLLGCPGGKTGPEPRAPDPTPPSPEQTARGDVLRLAWVGAKGEIVLLDPETGEMSVPAADAAWAAPLSWSGSGSVVAYVTDDEVLRLADLAAGTVQTIGTVAEGLPGAASVTPDGTRLAWVHRGALRLWPPESGTVLESAGHYTTPAWSPDGERVAVGAMGADESVDGGLWLVDEGLRAKQIVPAADDWGATQQIMWSPDGRWIAWARGAGDGWTGDIARADGSDLQRDAIGAGPIAWFPDSSALLVSIHIEAGAFATGIYRLADGSLTQIGPENWDSRAALSPDGSRAIAWGHDCRALVFDTATGEETPWPDDLPIAEAAWAPDGRLGVIVDTGDDGVAAWIGAATGEGAIVTQTEGGAPRALHWISLPPDAAALRGPLNG